MKRKMYLLVFALSAILASTTLLGDQAPDPSLKQCYDLYWSCITTAIQDYQNSEQTEQDFAVLCAFVGSDLADIMKVGDPTNYVYNPEGGDYCTVALGKCIEDMVRNNR